MSTAPEITPALVPEVTPQETAPPAAVPHSGEPEKYLNNALDPHLTAILKQAAPDKEAAKPVPPVAPAQPLEPKPAGGLNDLAPNDIENPQVRALGELLLSTAPNLDLNRAFGKAIEYGDPSLVDEAYLKEAGGDRANALTQIAKQIVSTVQAESEGTVKAIYESAGGQDTWNAAVAIFNKTADPHIKAVAVELLNSPNHSRIKSGAKFILEYAQKEGNLTEAAELVQGVSAPGALGNGISKDEFVAELSKIKPEHQNKNYVAEREALFNRRRAGKAQGK